MLISRLRKKPGIAVVTPESTEDLWILRRVLKSGDIITSHTKRVIKNQKEFTRPDKGERITVKLSVQLEKIFYRAYSPYVIHLDLLRKI